MPPCISLQDNRLSKHLDAVVAQACAVHPPFSEKAFFLKHDGSALVEATVN